MADRSDFIEYVHTDRPRAELFESLKAGKEYKFGFEDQEISVMMFDFRPEEIKNREKESVEKTKFSMYFTGFAQADLINPHDLTGGIIERAKDRGEVLLIPRFKDLPKVANTEDEILMTALGVDQVKVSSEVERAKLDEINGVLLKQLEADGVSIDLQSQDVTVYGWSDGDRPALQVAGQINGIPLKGRRDRSIPKRTFVSLSSTSIINEALPDKKATGTIHTERFNRQVEWAVYEETRLRLNHCIEQEKAIFERDFAQFYHQEMQAYQYTESSEMIERLKQKLLSTKEKDGEYKYPIMQKGLQPIPEAQVAMQKDVRDKTISTLLKLVSFPYGRKVFSEQFNQSLKDNLGMLVDVVRRAATGNSKYTYDQLAKFKWFKLALAGISSKKAIMTQFAKAEHRMDHICNKLETFDVQAIWPREDMIAPREAYGWTIRRILSERQNVENAEDIWSGLDIETAEDMRVAVEEGDDERVGELFMQNSEVLGFLLFPRAKRVRVIFVGRPGSMKATHVGITKNANDYLKYLD